MAEDAIFPDQTTNPAGMTGAAYAAAVKEEGDALWKRTVRPLGSVAGTGNAITAAAVPPLTAAPVDKQHFSLVPVAANTGAVTVNPGQGGAKALVDSDGDPLESGDLAIGEPVIFYKDATADNFRIVGLSRAQITRMILAQVGSNDPNLIGSHLVSAPEAFVEQLFTSAAYNTIRVKIEGISMAAAASRSVVVTLRNSGGAIVTLTSPSGSLSATGDVGTFTAEFTLDNISATGQYHGWLEGASKGVLRARVTAQGTVASASKPDRIWVALSGASNNIDQGRVTVTGELVPA